MLYFCSVLSDYPLSMRGGYEPYRHAPEAIFRWLFLLFNNLSKLLEERSLHYKVPFYRHHLLANCYQHFQRLVVRLEVLFDFSGHPVSWISRARLEPPLGTSVPFFYLYT